MGSATYDTISEDELIKNITPLLFLVKSLRASFSFCGKNICLLSQINAGCTIVSYRNAQIYNALA